MTAPLLLALFLAAAQEPVDILITGGTIVTMDGDMRVVEGGAVAVRGREITAVLSPQDQRPHARQTIHADGHLVIPGLVNAHGHAAMTLLRGIADDLSLLEWLQDYIFPAESKNVSPQFVYWGTMLGAVEMALSGTTTYADMYYFEEEVARATETVGIRGVLGQSVIGFPAPDYETPEEALAGAEAFIERFKDHPLIVPSVAPHALYTTPLDVVKKAHALAVKHGVPLQIHAVEPPEENDQMIEKLGKRTIHVLDDAGILTKETILHHAIWQKGIQTHKLTDEDIARIQKGGAGTSHNPESNMKTASGLSPVPEILAAGIAVGLGTDGAASNNNLDMFEEMDSAAKLHKLMRKDSTAMPARTVFAMATIGGAKALGLGDRIGSLEAGKLADIVLIDIRKPSLTPLYDVYSHLVYAIKGSHVDTVLVNGRVVVQGGRVRTVNTEEILEKANAIQAKILESLEKN